MRSIQPALQTKLDSGSTTMCWCMLITRTDGVKLGFTEHDRDLTFGGNTYKATLGLTMTAVEQSAQLNVDTQEASGPTRNLELSSDYLNERDLALGLFDNAAVELHYVDWSDTSLREHISSGNIGEVTRAGLEFKAELRGLSHNLNEEKGLIYQKQCSATLGDIRCQVNLEDAAYKGTGAVTLVDGDNYFEASGLDTFELAWFDFGKITWLTGDNAGTIMEVKRHALNPVSIETWQPMPFPVQVGDTFEIRAGCDLMFNTCTTKFDNALNHRGFPHIPGNNTVVNYPTSGENNDGGSLGF